MRVNKNYFTVTSAVLLYIAFTRLLSHLIGPSLDTVAENAMYLCCCLSATVLLILWCYSIQKRVVGRAVRSYLFNTGLCLVMWYFLRTVKYISLPPLSFLHRFCWYLYYVPIILIPLFGVFIVDYLDKPETFTASRRKRLLYIPAIILIAFVLTNDLHELVFSFPKGIMQYNDEYEYNILQYVNLAWLVALGAYFVMSLFLKSRLPVQRKLKPLPLFFLTVAAAFWLCCALGVFAKVDIVEANCIIIVMLIEGAIHMRQIRSNIGYKEILAGFSSPVWIVDDDYNTVYKSQAAVLSPAKKLMRNAEIHSITVGNTRLQSKRINAGHVIWETDLTSSNAIVEQLRDTAREISDENNLLSSEIALKKQKAHFDEQNMLFDRINNEIKPHLEKIEALSRNTQGSAKETLARIDCVGAFIKRRSNLRILSFENEYIDSRELELSFRESADSFLMTEASIYLKAECSGDIPAKNAITAYDICESILEDNLDRLNAVMVDLKTEDGGIYIRMNIGLDGEFVTTQAFDNSCVRFSVTENDAVVEILLTAGGDDE